MTELTAGLIGSHIQKTRLPGALRLLCDEAGIDFSFELMDTSDLASFDFNATVDSLMARRWTGVTITHPWKTYAAAYAGDRMRPEVQALGACNTLVFGPPLVGHNTDFTGFVSVWGWIMKGAAPGRVAMAGAGGVARALAGALNQLGAEDIAIWDIEAQRAQELASAFGSPVRAIALAEAPEAVRAAHGLVNATAIGMEHSPGMAFDAHLIGGQQWAFDAIYTPTNTEFLTCARAAGLQCLTGFDLFCHMAVGTFEAYTEVTADKRSALRTFDQLRPPA
jgi:shikimate dehydrogenase